ncbi:MAG: CoA-binding protein [Myxococcaceae bacterium]|nr:CoA-binding protein [Myxococcaceae bacterium]
MTEHTAGRLVTDGAEVARIAQEAKRVAVLGIKTERQFDQAAYYVPEYLQQAGVEVVPVPVYYPAVSEILGQKVYRKLAEVPGTVDILDVFRRPEDLLPHLDDVLAMHPRVVWLQSGIRHAEFAQQLVAAGIDVVQDHCLMVEHRRGVGSR